jgi:hypothetical protein
MGVVGSPVRAARKAKATTRAEGQIGLFEEAAP